MINRIKYWFFYRFHHEHQYYTVRTKLPPGYYDKDVLLENALATILINFIEQEKPFNHNQQAANREPPWDEIEFLYKFFKREKYWDVPRDDLTDKLRRIVELRGYFWT